MLDPLPPSTPTSIPLVLNFGLHYHELRVSDITSITVKAILKDVWDAGANKYEAFSTSMLTLRWITDKSMAFSPKNSNPWAGRYEAADWYYAKGHHLASTPITTDAMLQEKLKLRDSDTAIDSDAPVVRLYVIDTPYQPPRLLSNVENENHERLRNPYLYEDANPTFCAAAANAHTCFRQTRMAPLYEPAFAHAENALRNAQDARLNGLACHDDSDETFNARLFATQLRDAWANLKMGRSVEEGIHTAEALGELFRQLFDDPTLKVNVKSSGVDEDPWIKLNIEGRCPTAYDVPALYIVGKGRLISPSVTEGALEAKVLEGMLAYRNTVVGREYYPIYSSTRCPCLVIGTEGTTVQVYAAYLADRIYRSHICEFTLDGSLPSDEDALKLQVIRSTARMLHTSYAMVHTGALPGHHTYYSTRLLPNPSIVMPAPLPLRLRILDRVGANLGAYGDLFTGELGPEPSTDDDETQAGPKPIAVHVKFVDAYGVDAHRLLAEHKGADGEPRPLAPTLYWAGKVTPGGLMMIVMESLPDDARTVLWYQPEPEPDPDPEPEDPEFRYRKRLPGPDPVSWDELGDLRAAVELLHGHGFVHGDIRPQNVLLQRRPRRASDDGAGSGNGGTGAPRAYLVDFDVAGKEGEARYADLNPDVKWPRPASELNGQLIKKEHDVFMLERLLKVPKRKHEKERGHQEDGDVDNRKSKRRRVSW